MKASTIRSICRGAVLSVAATAVLAMDWLHMPPTLSCGWAIRMRATPVAHRHYAIGGYENGALQVLGDGAMW